MKIHSVTMKGFGPYLEQVVVDVDAFDDDGIFLLAGRTGAGKSSILDALTYGLFGTVPRYGGKVDEEIRSRYLEPGEPTEVAVEFTVGGTRYRVWRSPSFARPKKVGTGFTTQAARIELGRVTDAGVEVFETKIGNAETHVQQLVGLDAAQFLQVVLLAQGQFQEFLVATSRERQGLLRTLFRTRRFDDYARDVQERARTEEASLQHVLTTIEAKVGTLAQQTGSEAPGTSADAVDPWLDELVADLRSSLDTAATEAARTADELTAADAAWQAARTTAERQRRRAEAAERHAALLAEQDLTQQRRQQVAAARRAALAHQAVTAQSSAAEALTTATAALDALAPGPSDDLASLREREHDLAGQVGALATAAEQERALPGLRRLADEARVALTDLENQTARQRDQQRELRSRQADVDRQVESLGDLGARHEKARSTLEALRARLAQATQAEVVAEQVRQAEHEHVSLSEAALEANRAVVALRRRQLEGWSAEVAAQLEAGAACPVCGSTEHPAPAEARDDHVGEADLESAHHAHERSRDAESGAGRKVEALRASRDAARAAADGSVDGLTADVASAEAQLAEATSALTARQALTAEATTLREDLAALEAALGTADERRHEATAVASAHQTSLTSATTLVARARGDAESVQERQDHLRTQLATVRRLITATEAVLHRTDVAHEAAEALEIALGENGFASAAEASAAVVAPAEVVRLEALVGSHERALAVVTATLAEPELADLPDEPVDPTPLHEARVLASTVAAEAADVRATAAKSLSSCEALVADISAALQASAEQLARYDTVRELDLALRGYGANQLRMPLETFALVAELEDILGAANVRLATMTHGRYQLLHSDDAGSRGTSGLELTVLDAHTGDSRSPSSLSGGEKFQASLALALGLAEVVTSRAGGLRLDTLFIDEGFGSLDAETLETTMETLDSLREGGRTIGLISHVEAMRESIPAQVQIDVTDGGWSTIRSTG